MTTPYSPPPTPTDENPRLRRSRYGGVYGAGASSGPRWRRRTVILTLLGFLLSGFGGAFAYFAPALATAVQATGQNVISHAVTTGGPFTVLLLGSDNDAKFSSNHVLTQSMILVRVDPGNQHATMLSIPRDLYVPLSTGGTDKIDKAYSYGGAAAAIETVQNNFHVHVDHYAWIGLQGLVTLIDKVGGIDVVTTNPVVDDYYPADLSGGNPYAYQRVAVMPGPQHLDGMHALEYVRSRHDDLRGDFGRSQRQQQVLLALRNKSKQFGPADLPDFASALNGQIKTDMDLGQVRDLMPLAGDLSLQSVDKIILLSPATKGEMVGSQDVLIPNWDVILPLVQKGFP